MAKCDFCKEELQKNVYVLGLSGMWQVVPLYCENHGVGYTKEKEAELKKSIAIFKGTMRKQV